MLLSLLLITMFLSTPLAATTRVPMRTKVKINSLSEHTEPVIDPLISIDDNNPQLLLVMFKDFKSMKQFEKTARANGIDIVEEYWLIPLLLVKTKPRNLIHIAASFTGIHGIYANREFFLPKYVIGNNKEFKPTTKESAQSIGADYVWDQGYDGSGAKIAIIDTGIYKDHPDLKKNGATKVIAEKSFVLQKYGYDQNDPDPTDKVGHGTGVAGVAAGTGEGDPDVGLGVAPGALLINARVFPATGGATLAAITAAIQWSVSQGADVINMSLGGGTWYVDPLYYAIKAAAEHGVVVVVAAGNEGDTIGSMSVGSPGDVEFAITVAATNVGGTAVKSYSSYGPTVRFSVKPDISAPSGTAIIWIPPANYQASAEGTSFSSPHVAGAAALLADYLGSQGISGAARVGAIKAALMKTAKHIGSYGELKVGAGYVQVNDAFDLLKSLVDSGSLKLSTVSPSSIPTGISSSKTYFPFKEKIFRGMKLEFNVSIITSYSTQVTVSLDSELSQVFEPHYEEIFNVTAGTTIWEFNATVKSDAPLGSHEGVLTFRDADNNVIGTIRFKFVVEKPILFWAFDIKHTGWVPTDFRWGQFNEFSILLESLGVAIEHIYPSQVINENLLSRYDVLFAPDTASYYAKYDMSTGNYIGPALTPFSDSEISNITAWVENGGVFIFNAMNLSTVEATNDPTNVNKLAQAFGFKFGEVVYSESQPAAIDVIPNHILTKGVDVIPFYGVEINVLSDAVITIAKYENYPVVVARFYLGNSGTGMVLGLGTNFVFDNWAMTGGYSGVPYVSVQNFTRNIVEFANKSKELKLVLPDKISGQVYSLDFYSPYTINRTVVEDSEGELRLIPRKINDDHYLVRYAPRVTGTQVFKAQLFEEAIVKGETKYYSLTVTRTFKVDSAYSDTTKPEITVVSVTPSSPNEFDSIKLAINVTDDTWVIDVKVNYKGNNYTAEYNMNDGLWYVEIPAAGIGSFSVSVNIVAKDAFGNTGKLNYSVGLTPIYTISIVGIIAIIAIIGVIIKIKRK